jgi:hypothetical protein
MADVERPGMIARLISLKETVSLSAAILICGM